MTVREHRPRPNAALAGTRGPQARRRAPLTSRRKRPSTADACSRSRCSSRSSAAITVASGARRVACPAVEERLAFGCRAEEDRAAVARVTLARDEPGRLHRVDEAGHRRGSHALTRGELAERARAAEDESPERGQARPRQPLVVGAVSELALELRSDADEARCELSRGGERVHIRHRWSDPDGRRRRVASPRRILARPSAATDLRAVGPALPMPAFRLALPAHLASDRTCCPVRRTSALRGQRPEAGSDRRPYLHVEHGGGAGCQERSGVLLAMPRPAVESAVRGFDAGHVQPCAEHPPLP